MAFDVRIDRERCKGCDLCIAVCAGAVLRMAEELNSRGEHFAEVVDIAKCTGCRNCSDMCPDTAIEIVRGDD